MIRNLIVQDPVTGQFQELDGVHTVQQANQWGQDRANQWINQNFDRRSGTFYQQPQSPAMQPFMQNTYSNWSAQQQRNLIGAGGYSGGGGYAPPGLSYGDSALNRNFTSAINNAIQNPGLSRADEEDMLDASNEEFRESEQDAQLRASELAGAMGFGESGDRFTASREIGEDYAAKRNAAERDIRLGAENQRQQQLMQALGIGASYLSAEKGLAASQANRQQDLALQNLRNGNGYSGGYGGGYSGGGYSGGNSGGGRASGLPAIFGSGRVIMAGISGGGLPRQNYRSW